MLPYPLIYPQMAQMAQMENKALTQAGRALSEQYWHQTGTIATRSIDRRRLGTDWSHRDDDRGSGKGQHESFR